MQVETFEVLEQTDSVQSPDEICEEQIKFIEELDLKGQQSLVKKAEAIDDKAEICPYRQMSAEEARVYGWLCPAKTPLKNYADQAIPLRVLQVAAHAQSLGFFESIDVWHTRSASENKDPVLVAKRPKPNAAYENDLFLLARWGKELEPYEKLKAMAAKRAKENRIEKLKQIQIQVQRDLDRSEDIADTTILGWQQTEPNFFPNDY